MLQPGTVSRHVVSEEASFTAIACLAFPVSPPREGFGSQSCDYGRFYPVSQPSLSQSYEHRKPRPKEADDESGRKRFESGSVVW